MHLGSHQVSWWLPCHCLWTCPTQRCEPPPLTAKHVYDKLSLRKACPFCPFEPHCCVFAKLLCWCLQKAVLFDGINSEVDRSLAVTSRFMRASTFNFCNVFLQLENKTTCFKPQTLQRRFNRLYVSVVAMFSLLQLISLALAVDIRQPLFSVKEGITLLMQAAGNTRHNRLMG